MKTTLLTNVYNEEYLLPFWLHHHKDMFDDIIIVDYRSTDRSLDICKQIFPRCQIIPSLNESFGAVEIDREFMLLEDNVPGIKIILNTTEFLFCNRPIREIFQEQANLCYSINVITPYSAQTYPVHNYYQLMSQLLNDDIVFHYDRFTRQIHSFPNGNYFVGRHYTNWPSTVSMDMFIIWFGYYPMNEKLMERKLQVQKNIPEKDKIQNYSRQHFFTREKIMEVNHQKVTSAIAKSLADIHYNAFQWFQRRYARKTFVVITGGSPLGHRLVEKLGALQHRVIVVETGLQGGEGYKGEEYKKNTDIRNYECVQETLDPYDKIDGIFHAAALTDEAWCHRDPLLCYQTNVMGTMHVLQYAHERHVPRVVISSGLKKYRGGSYGSSMAAVENMVHMYRNMYQLPAVLLPMSHDCHQDDDVVWANILAMFSPNPLRGVIPLDQTAFQELSLEIKKKTKQ